MDNKLAPPDRPVWPHLYQYRDQDGSGLVCTRLPARTWGLRDAQAERLRFLYFIDDSCTDRPGVVGARRSLAGFRVILLSVPLPATLDFLAINGDRYSAVDLCHGLFDVGRPTSIRTRFGFGIADSVSVLAGDRDHVSGALCIRIGETSTAVRISRPRDVDRPLGSRRCVPDDAVGNKYPR